ncbi:unnamed protein product [Lupinus luteus]|uniref:Uncharacterized protein n=1 Tax=Lupinus luteus TaxID=3873 RepID=A0AAV1VRT9_LUPLU
MDAQRQAQTNLIASAHDQDNSGRQGRPSHGLGLGPAPDRDKPDKPGQHCGSAPGAQFGPATPGAQFGPATPGAQFGPATPGAQFGLANCGPSQNCGSAPGAQFGPATPGAQFGPANCGPSQNYGPVLSNSFVCLASISC